MSNGFLVALELFIILLLGAEGERDEETGKGGTSPCPFSKELEIYV